MALDLVVLAMLLIGERWGTGYVQRLFLLLGAAWITLLAAWVLRLASRQRAPGPGVPLGRRAQ